MGSAGLKDQYGNRTTAVRSYGVWSVVCAVYSTPSAAMADPMAADLERSVSRVVVAQTARSLGFSACRSGALDVLVGVLQHYLKEACHLAHEAAEQGGRAQPCLTDVLRALRSLGCDVARLAGYVSACFDGSAAEVPFAQPLPRYPLRKRPRAAAPSFREAGEAPPGVQYPVWAPALPDPHTYRATPAHAPAKPDDARVRRELTQQTVSAEAALARLADALAPSAPTDYAVAAPERWGGDLRHPGAQRRREAEQRAVSAEAGAGAALNPYLRAGGAGAGTRATTGPKHAAVAVLAALPPPLPAPEAGAEAGWVTQADTPAAEAVRYAPTP